MRRRIALAWLIALGAACTARPRPPAEQASVAPQPPPAPAPEPEPEPPASACRPSRRSPEGPVALTIVDLLGRSIAGAAVTSAVDGDDGGVRREQLVTDADGRVTVPARARLSVAAPGFVALDNADAGTLDPPRLHLLPASTIAGQVRDAAARRPLAGVALVVVQQLGDDRAPAGRATTDADGRFRVTGLAPGRYHVVAEDDHRRGHRGVAVGLGEALADVDVPLHRLVRVEGRVRAVNASTCTSGHVTLHVGRAFGLGGCTCAGEPDTVTAKLDPKTGAVRFLVAPDQTYGVETHCADHLIGVHAAIKARRRDIRGLVWTARSGLTVRGRVVDGDGKPLAGLDVTAKYDPDEYGYQEVDSPGTSTDANGEFTLTGLASGRPELLVTGSPDGGWYSAEQDIELDDRDITGLELRAEFRADDDDGPSDCRPPPPPLPELRGVVVDGSGVPVADAVVVRVTDRRPSRTLAAIAGWRGEAPVLTDERGVFRLPFDPEERLCKGGECTDALVAYRPGGGEGQLLAPSLDAPAELRVGPRATITGTVKDLRGRAVTTFGTTLDQNSMAPPIDYQYDPAGAFELPGVLPGTYRLGLHSPAGDLGRRITVEAGQRLHVDLVVEPARDE